MRMNGIRKMGKNMEFEITTDWVKSDEKLPNEGQHIEFMYRVSYCGRYSTLHPRGPWTAYKEHLHSGVVYWRPLQENWISVDDRLPNDKQMIAYASKCLERSAIGRYAASESNVMPSATKWLPWYDVTHWMPLPEVPDVLD